MSENLLALLSENRKIVPISSQHVRLVFDPNCAALLVDPLALCNNPVGELDGGLIEKNEVYGGGAERGSNLVGQAGPMGRSVV